MQVSACSSKYLFSVKMTTAIDRETIIGRATPDRINTACNQCVPRSIDALQVLPYSHTESLRFYCTEIYGIWAYHILITTFLEFEYSSIMPSCKLGAIIDRNGSTRSSAYKFQYRPARFIPHFIEFEPIKWF
jgi:hypothetical protein